MIKLVIFDLDGTLCNLKDLHYEALNKALEGFGYPPISFEDHVSKYDGLPTWTKLKMLGLDGYDITDVEAAKQEFTKKMIKGFLKPDMNIIGLVAWLKFQNIAVVVASNARTATVNSGLAALGLEVDFVLSNEDVVNPKPNPEIFLKAMVMAGVAPSETIIVEDSKYGREAAVASGAWVCGVDGPDDLGKGGMGLKLAQIYNLAKEEKPIRWAGKSDTTVLIPMAGAGSRFKEAGYDLPKPLIDVNGKPMIQRVVENLNIDANFVFVIQREHYFKWDINYLLNLIAPGCKIVLTDGLTEGAACTTLLAKEFINNDDHLLIANSDQLLEWDSCDFFYNMLSSGVDGGIVTFRDTDPKWSFARVEKGFVVKTAEKTPISDIATSGVYWWNKGSDYVKYAEERIAQNIRHNGEFYVCPTFNNLIADGGKVKTYDIKRMWGVGTPDDLRAFLRQSDFCPT